MVVRKLEIETGDPSEMGQERSTIDDALETQLESVPEQEDHREGAGLREGAFFDESASELECSTTVRGCVSAKVSTRILAELCRERSVGISQIEEGHCWRPLHFGLR